jgi:hypothetical protein
MAAPQNVGVKPGINIYFAYILGIRKVFPFGQGYANQHGNVLDAPVDYLVDIHDKVARFRGCRCADYMVAVFDQRQRLVNADDFF